MNKSYIYIGEIRDEDDNELLVRISAYSQESFEEDQGKSKWSEAVKRYEEKLAKELEDELEEEKELEKDKLPPVAVENGAPDFLQPEKELSEENEEAINEELEFAANQDFKLEEGLEHEKENL